MEIPEARWIVWITVLATAIVVAIYVAVYFRNLAFGKSESASDHLSEFRRLKEEGKLGDKEYAQLKSTIKDHGEFSTDKTVDDPPNKPKT